MQSVLLCWFSQQVQYVEFTYLTARPKLANLVHVFFYMSFLLQAVN